MSWSLAQQIQEAGYLEIIREFIIPKKRMERKSILGSKDKMSPYSRIRLEFFTKAAWKERPYIMKSNWCEIANIILWSCIGAWKVRSSRMEKPLINAHPCSGFSVILCCGLWHRKTQASRDDKRFIIPKKRMERKSIPEDFRTETCKKGFGSLLLEHICSIEIANG